MLLTRLAPDGISGEVDLTEGLPAGCRPSACGVAAPADPGETRGGQQPLSPGRARLGP